MEAKRPHSELLYVCLLGKAGVITLFSSHDSNVTNSVCPWDQGLSKHTSAHVTWGPRRSRQTIYFFSSFFFFINTVSAISQFDLALFFFPTLGETLFMFTKLG